MAQIYNYIKAGRGPILLRTNFVYGSKKLYHYCLKANLHKNVQIARWTI